MLSPKKSIYVSLDQTGDIQVSKEWNKLDPGSNARIESIKPRGDNTAKMIVGNFEAFKAAYQNGNIDLSQYDTIYIDEVDVNGLSDARQDFLNTLLDTHRIRIVGMSATEHQASGKKVSDFFETNISRLPMPESLITLYQDGLIPNITFRDVYLDASLDLRSREKRAE